LSGDNSPAKRNDVHLRQFANANAEPRTPINLRQILPAIALRRLDVFLTPAERRSIGREASAHRNRFPEAPIPKEKRPSKGGLVGFVGLFQEG
jgi:hypothetical protein